MRNKIITILVLSAVLLLLTACGNEPAATDTYAPLLAEETDYTRDFMPPMPNVQIMTDSPEITMSAQLTVESIPQGVEPAEFLRGLGYDSFIEHEFLRSGSDWIAFLTNTELQDLRIINLIPRYEASFDDGWQLVRHYAYTWTRLEIDLLPDVPFVMAWNADERGITEMGLDGVSFVDADGLERFFILRQRDDVTYLEEFENSPHSQGSPMISILRPTPEIELVAAWIVDWRHESERDEHTTRDNFLQQFQSFTEFDNPSVSLESWVAFGASMDLRDFQFFGLGHACDPWVGDAWHPFYVGMVIGSQSVLPFGEPVVVPWLPGGTWPHFGISFLDEDGQRRNFALNSNEGSGFPPMFIFEFDNRVYCPNCASDTP